MSRRRDRYRHWSVMVACNYHRNGMFTGQCRAVDFLAPDGDIALSFDIESKNGRPAAGRWVAEHGK